MPKTLSDDGGSGFCTSAKPSPIINVDEEWEKFSQNGASTSGKATHPITSWRKLAASIAGFVLISGIAFAAIHTYIKRSQETTR